MAEAITNKKSLPNFTAYSADSHLTGRVNPHALKTAAYWFTASTSFASPAVTLARSFTATFSGIRPSDAPGFMAAQLTGALAATFLFRWLAPGLKKSAPDVVVPHGEPRKDF